MAKRYFKNLDGLRFIAAATVAIAHLETFKQYRNIPFIQNRFIENSAQIAVTFFFVLSGFLIMWWLLEETSGDTTKISPRTFYSNRIARTWPLYFLIVILSICISFINGTFANDLLASKRYIAYLLFLPNTVDIFFGKDVYLGVTWSLAVEELFYFFFPLLLLRIRKERLLKTLFIYSVVFIAISTVLNPIFLRILFPHSPLNTIIRFLSIFFERYRFYSFFCGALAAALLFYKYTPPTFSNEKILFIGTALFISFLFFFGVTFSFLTQQVYSVLFAVFLFFITYQNTGTILLNNRLAILGGKISYGIYLLHMFLVGLLVDHYFVSGRAANKSLMFFISWFLFPVFLFLISYLSYKLFENPIRLAARKRLIAKTQKSKI